MNKFLDPVYKTLTKTMKRHDEHADTDSLDVVVIPTKDRRIVIYSVYPLLDGEFVEMTDSPKNYWWCGPSNKEGDIYKIEASMVGKHK